MLKKILLSSLILLAFNAQAALKWQTVPKVSGWTGPMPDLDLINTGNSSPFVFVPGSEGLHGNANGWYVMSTEATPYDPTGWTLESVQTYKHTSAKPNPKITSKANNSAYPIATISQANAKLACANDLVDASGNAVTGGRLLSASVWARIAANITSNPSNWYTGSAGANSGAVGTGQMSRGHASNSPNTALPAGFDIYPAQWYETRKHYLTNGGVLWDFAGNVREWFEDTHSNTGGSTSYSYEEFTAATNMGAAGFVLEPDGYNAAWSGYNTTQGMGKIFGNGSTAGTSHAAIFGGYWSNTTIAGVWTSYWFGVSTSVTSGDLGFRCMIPAP